MQIKETLIKEKLRVPRCMHINKTYRESKPYPSVLSCAFRRMLFSEFSEIKFVSRKFGIGDSLSDEEIGIDSIEVFANPGGNNVECSGASIVAVVLVVRSSWCWFSSSFSSTSSTSRNVSCGGGSTVLRRFQRPNPSLCFLTISCPIRSIVRSQVAGSIVKVQPPTN